MDKQAHPLENDVYANDSILYEKLPKNADDNEKLMGMRKKKKRGCCLNCKYMMCYHKIPTQKQLYQRRLDALSITQQ